MLPAIARAAISAYTSPGDLVLDPVCGVGTTLVEAIHLGRHAVGVECEPVWADIARASLEFAAASSGHTTGIRRTGRTWPISLWAACSPRSPRSSRRAEICSARAASWP